MDRARVAGDLAGRSGMLGLPIAWCVAIGQAQVPLTFLTALGAPWSIALAANIKLFPALVALWWIGRREWRCLGVFLAWMAGIVLLQVVLAPQAMPTSWTPLTLKQVGEVRNLSPYAFSPLLWAVLVVGGVAAHARLAPTRWGWAAAVALSVLATPRLLVLHVHDVPGRASRTAGDGTDAARDNRRQRCPRQRHGPSLELAALRWRAP